MASLEHRLQGSLDGTSGGISYVFFLFYSFISYVFLSYFMVLLKQLRRLYTSGFIFQVPPVSDYITWCTNAYLRVRCTSLLFTRSMHQPLLTRRCTNHLFIKL